MMKKKLSKTSFIISLLLAIVLHISVIGSLFFLGPFFKHEKRQPKPYIVKLFSPTPKIHPSVSNTQGTKITKKPSPVISKSNPKPRPKKQEEDKKKTIKKTETKFKEKLNVKKEEVKKIEKQKTKPKLKTNNKKTKNIKSQKEISLNRKKTKKEQKKEVKNKKSGKKKILKPHINEEQRLTQKIKELQKKIAAEKQEEAILKKKIEAIKKNLKSRSQGGQGIANGASHPGEFSPEAQYAAKVTEVIKNNWYFPKYLVEDMRPEAIVAITIDRKGNILKAHIIKSSGYPAFDRSVMKAVKDSNPLPAPPPSLGPGNQDIEITFNPNKMSF